MIKINCQNCGKNLEAPDEAAGGKGKCSDCETVFAIPMGDDVANESTPGQESINDMKKCPYCAEDIKKEAVKCRYCGSELGEQKKEQEGIKLKCGNCEYRFVFPKERAGKEARCPNCGMLFDVPKDSTICESNPSINSGVREYKRTCRLCGNVWYSEVDEEIRLLRLISGESVGAIGLSGAAAQRGRSSDALQEQLNNRQRCSECLSADCVTELSCPACNKYMSSEGGTCPNCGSETVGKSVTPLDSCSTFLWTIAIIVLIILAVTSC